MLDNINNNNYYYYMSSLKHSRKHSRKRDEILKIIRSTKSHPGAQWIYEQLKPSIPDLSLGTVYRNISFFREEGLVASVGVVHGEERFDSETAPHPHLVCGHCGAVMDLPCPDEGMLKRAAEDFEAQGTVIDYRRTVFYGLCRNCAENRRGPDD
jgi:Fur family peroxide stress response transcriptional regulator